MPAITYVGLAAATAASMHACLAALTVHGLSSSYVHSQRNKERL